MLRKLKNSIWRFLNILGLGGYIQLYLHSYLKDIGWFRSFHHKQSVDRNGHAIPWLSYSFIHFLEPRLHKQMNLFEYGCGNSTIWFAQRVNWVDAVENDKNWIAKIQNQLSDNTAIVYRKVQENENGEYAKAIATTGKFYDIVVVDGRDRNHCIKQAEKYLSPQGVIVLDNSDRPDYQEGINFLLSKGFKKIDFIGIVPIVAMVSSTSVFYKNENCLNI
jgi:hypothetical protein